MEVWMWVRVGVGVRGGGGGDEGGGVDGSVGGGGAVCDLSCAVREAPGARESEAPHLVAARALEGLRRPTLFDETSEVRRAVLWEGRPLPVDAHRKDDLRPRKPHVNGGSGIPPSYY